MTSPWHNSVFHKLRETIRFVLWSALTANAAIAAYYSVKFTAKVFDIGWQWLENNAFDNFR